MSELHELQVVRPKKAAFLLGIHPKTLQQYAREGKISCITTPGGTRRYPVVELRKIVQQYPIENAKGKLTDTEPEEQPKRCALYGRVSSHEQKRNGALQRQLEQVRSVALKKGYEVVAEITEVSSGLNERRRGLQRLITLAKLGQIDKILITYPERFTRFGYRYLQHLFAFQQVTIECMQDTREKEPQQELVDDLLAIISTFAGRLYGMRSAKSRQLQKQLKQQLSAVQPPGELRGDK